MGFDRDERKPIPLLASPLKGEEHIIYTAAAPATISDNSFVIAAWRVLL